MRYEAKHYAEALRSVVRDRDAFARAIAGLAEVADALDADASVRTFFTHGAASQAAQEKVLHDVFGSRLLEEAYRTLCALLTHGQMGLLLEVVRSCRAMDAAEGGVAHVRVESAVPLAKDILERIHSVLARKLGRAVLLADIAVRPEVIGGLRITIDGSRTWDKTVAGTLSRLERHIAQVA